MIDLAGHVWADGDLQPLAADEPYQGLRRVMIDGRAATLARYDFGPGAKFPLHRHPQEQLTLVVAGSVSAIVDGHHVSLHAGQGFVARADESHGVEAGPDGAILVAVIAPARTAPPEVLAGS